MLIRFLFSRTKHRISNLSGDPKSYRLICSHAYVCMYLCELIDVHRSPGYRLSTGPKRKKKQKFFFSLKNPLPEATWRYPLSLVKPFKAVFRRGNGLMLPLDEIFGIGFISKFWFIFFSLSWNFGTLLLKSRIFPLKFWIRKKRKIVWLGVAKS